MDITNNTQNIATKQFDSVEINELKDIRTSYEQITLALGQLEMQKRELKKNEQKVDERLTALVAQETVFLNKVVEKYGEGTFDISTGIFTPKAKQ